MDLITIARANLDREPIVARKQKSFKPYLMEAINDLDNQRKGKDEKLHRDTGGSDETPGRDDKETKGGLEWIA